MVRLGVNGRKLRTPTVPCFNSSMVRLGVMDESYAHQQSLVSIPVWCDWELCFCVGRVPEILCFNSSMVRLGVKIIQAQLSTTDVSIPVWCDWEKQGFRRDLLRDAVSIPVWCDWEVTAVCFNFGY